MMTFIRQLACADFFRISNPVFTAREPVENTVFRFLGCLASCMLLPSLAFAQSGNTTLGTNAGISLTTGSSNTLIGDTAGAAVTTGSNNTCVGQNAGAALTLSSDNTCIGQDAGAGTTTGVDNTFVGIRAGLSNTNSSNNTFVGYDAGRANNGGLNNTFIGEEAGRVNTTGNRNVFVGEDAGRYNTTGSDNTFVGSGAGKGDYMTLLTGSYNTCIGGPGMSTSRTFSGVTFQRADGGPGGRDLTTGVANTFIGAGAGVDNGVGIGNTFAGHAAGANTEHASFNTFIGVQAGWDNNRSNNKTDANRNTYLGFGVGQTNRDGEDNVGLGAFGDFNSLKRSRCTFIGANTKPRDDDTILIGYGTQATGSNSTVIGSSAQVTAANEVVIGSSTITSIGGPVTWTATSDGRLKTSVIENVPGLDFVNRLRPVTYHIDAVKAQMLRGSELPDSMRPSCEEKPKVSYTGFIAQEVQSAAEAVDYDFSGVRVPADPSSQTYGLRYAEFVVPLTRAVQELRGQIKSQITTIDGYVATIQSQEELIGRQAAALTQYEQMAEGLLKRLEQLKADLPQDMEPK